MRKIKLYCIYSLVGLIQVLNPILSNAQTHEVIPPSPTAAALGKYVDNPVSLFTGKPNITIPLYELKTKGYSLPISLSYNATGVQIEDIASNVGLGWSLNAGGVITRAVKEAPDDKFIYNSAEGFGIKEGILTHKKDLNDYKIDIFYNFFSFDEKMYETEPDIFYFNFGGYSGKFFFQVKDGAISIKSVPYQNLKFSYEQGADGQLISFTITDKNGVKYYFNDIETTRNTKLESYHFPIILFDMSTRYQHRGYRESDPGVCGHHIEYFDEFNSSWYLSNIETPQGDIITFSYLNDEVEYLVQLPEQSWGKYIAEDYDPNNALENTYRSFEIIKNIHKRKVLASIETDNILIDFQHGDRYDLNKPCLFDHNSFTADGILGYYEGNYMDYNGSRPERITDMIIYSKFNGENKRIKRWGLIHDYFESDTEEVIKYRANKYFSHTDESMSSYYKRLRLIKLYEYGETDASRVPAYKFDYKYEDFTGDASHVLPHRFSFQRDLWGFYNGAENNNTLIPALRVYSNLFVDGRKYSVYDLGDIDEGSHYLKGADRLPNAMYMDIGMLTRITYPTGGYTQYDYEPHDFYYSGKNLIGGGLRLKSIVKNDNGVSGNDIIYNYTYKVDGEEKSSGSVFSIPVFADNCRGSLSMEYDNHNYITSGTPWLFNNLVTFNRSQTSLGTTGGIRIGYSRVTESIVGKGKTVYNYATNISDNPPSPVFVQNVRYTFANEINFEDIWVNKLAYSFATSDITRPAEEVLFNDNFASGSELDMTNNSFMGYVSIGGLFNSHIIEPLDINKETTFDQLTNNISSMIYPYPAKLNYDWNMGHLLSKVAYNEHGDTVKKEIFNYEPYFPYGYIQPTEVFGIKTGNLWPAFKGNGYIGLDDNKLYSGFRHCMYRYVTDVARVLKSKEERVYDLNDNTKYVSKLISYAYNNFGQVQTVSTTDSKGDEMKTQYQYPGDYSNYSSTNMPDEEYARGIHVARYKNIINKPIETVRLKNNKVTGASLLLYKSEGSLQTGFDLFPYQTYELEWSEPVSDFSYSKIDYEGDILKFSKNFRYKLANTFGPFDQKHNILQISKNNDLDHSYIWGYNGQYPVAKITNSKNTDSYAQNFENPTNSENTSWLNNISSVHQTITSDNSISGNKSLYVLSSTNMSNYAMSLNLTSAEIDVDKSYTFSAWAWAPVGHDDVNIQFKYFDGTSWHNLAKTSYSGNGEWQLLRVTQDFSGFSNVQRIEAVARNYGSNGKICYWDDIRLHPANAQMATYTYEPLIGMTSETGPDNKTAYYEYDDLGRLTHVKDYKNNIINRYRYRYDGEAFSITIPDWPDELEVNKDNLLFNLSGGTQTFEITSKVDWTITFEGDITGLDVTPVNGSGNATIQVTCGAWDPAAPPRIVPLTITGGGLTEEVHVVQVYH